MITTHTTAGTRWFEGAVEVFPCRCGSTHRGAYAVEEHSHHTCFHASGLSRMPVEAGIPEQAICMECGQVFDILN